MTHHAPLLYTYRTSVRRLSPFIRAPAISWLMTEGVMIGDDLMRTIKGHNLTSTTGFVFLRTGRVLHFPRDGRH